MFSHMKTEEVKEPETTKAKIIDLLNRAKDFAWISTGLNKEFYNDPEVIEVMKKSFGRVKHIRVLLSGDEDVKRADVPWFFDFAKELGDKIQIRRCARVPHWVVSDGKHFRLEKAHEIGKIGTNNLFVRDVSPPAISDLLMRDFDNWWFESAEIKP